MPKKVKPSVEPRGERQLTLRCYCCGEPLNHKIAFVTMQIEGADRGFVMKPEHADRALGVYEIFERNLRTSEQRGVTI